MNTWPNANNYRNFCQRRHVAPQSEDGDFGLYNGTVSSAEQNTVSAMTSMHVQCCEAPCILEGVYTGRIKVKE